MTTHMMSQQAYRNHMRFAESEPLWAQLATEAVNRWGSGEVTLVQAIGEALMATHAAGIAGELPEPARKPAAPQSRIIRRTR